MGWCAHGVAGKLLIGAGESSLVAAVCLLFLLWVLGEAAGNWTVVTTKSGFIVFNCGGKTGNFEAGMWKQGREGRCWGDRGPAQGHREHYFLPTREITSIAAWFLPSEALRFSHYCCYETNEHVLVLSPESFRGWRGRGPSAALGPLCSTRAGTEICADLGCAHWRCARTFL